MIKTLKISFSLKITYRVNSILYSLKQIPLLKKALPEYLYQVEALKILAGIISGIWELLSVFLGKLLYLLVMVYGACSLYDGFPKGELFLHFLLPLTILGGFLNTSIFNPTKDKYYAMFLMRMDARDYTIVNYAYAILKVIVGFLPFTLWFGILGEVPFWLCFVLPFSIAGCKLCVTAYSLWDYERRGHAYNENKINKYQWLCVAILLALAYGLPAAGFVLPKTASAAVMLLFIPGGAAGIWKVYSFRDYKEINRELLSQPVNQMNTSAQITKAANEKRISADVSITSNRKGFEYLNELFIKRHRKILWNSTKKISYVCAMLVCGILLVFYLKPESKPVANQMVMVYLPYFTFIMYAINRGTSFTQALFMNCDHSLLTYSFYKQPQFVLRLFQIRLREIMKINAVPALIIGAGLSLILYTSGGTKQPLNYIILIVSVLCMSMFFSVHYLTIYYLLQPYNAGTELKGGTYKIILWATYFCCFWLMYVRMSIFVFGIMTILFCALYSVIACILVYRLAPKRFKLRM